MKKSHDRRIATAPAAALSFGGWGDYTVWADHGFTPKPKSAVTEASSRSETTEELGTEGDESRSDGSERSGESEQPPRDRPGSEGERAGPGKRRRTPDGEPDRARRPGESAGSRAADRTRGRGKAALRAGEAAPATGGPRSAARSDDRAPGRGTPVPRSTAKSGKATGRASDRSARGPGEAADHTVAPRGRTTSGKTADRTTAPRGTTGPGDAADQPPSHTTGRQNTPKPADPASHTAAPRNTPNPGETAAHTPSRGTAAPRSPEPAGQRTAEPTPGAGIPTHRIGEADPGTPPPYVRGSIPPPPRARHLLPPEVIVSATGRHRRAGALAPDLAAVCRMCQIPTSVAEVSAYLLRSLDDTCALVREGVDAGLLVAETADLGVAGRPPLALLHRVHQGLLRL